MTGTEVGQRITLNLNAVGDRFDTYLQLVNATTGQAIAFDDDSGPNANSELQLTIESGVEYIVRVRSYDAYAVRDYTLTATPQSTLAGTISANQSLNGSLSFTDYGNPTRLGAFRDDYRLTGATAGQQIRINLDGNFDTYLQLINANTGEVLAFKDDANGVANSELSFTVQSAVNYIVRVSSYYADATGNYNLRTSTIGSTIGVSQTVSGVLDSTDPSNALRQGAYRDDYRLTGTSAGQQIRINLNSSSFDTYLQLINAGTGEAIAFNDDANSSTNSELSFSVQSGVNYIIRVTSYASSSTGVYTLSTTSSSGGGDWIFTNITDTGLQAIIRSRSADGILDRNDMLAIFRDGGLTDGGAIDSAEQNSLRNLAANATRFRMADYVQFLVQQVADGISTNMSASAFDSNLVGRWFLGTMAPTARFNSDYGNFNFTYVQVQGRLYGSSGQPRIGDIDQGQFGDCAFLAALGATFGAQSSDAGNQRSSAIESMIIDNGDNTYTIRFYQGSTPQWVTVDRRVPFTNQRWFGARANGSTDPNNQNNVLWVPLVERAYAQWREWREGVPGYNLIGNGDHPYNPLGYITGRNTTQYGAGGSTGSFSSVTFTQIQNALANGRFVEIGR